MPQPKAVVVLVTCPDRLVAGRIARHLVSRRLAACVNIIAGVRSLFWWQGKVQACSEVLLIIKTQRSLFRRLKAAVKSKHPYETPEIITLRIDAGDPKYMDWIRQAVSFKT